MLRRILIIEDSVDAQELYRRVLEMDSFSVVPALSGEKALEYLKSNDPPDLILLDLSMPGMGGEQFVTQLKDNAAWQSIKVLVISGWDSLKSRAEKLNVDGYIQKPVGIDQLLEAVHRALGSTCR